MLSKINRICVEGNIGCGKTTQIRKINNIMRLPIFLEPVDAWKDWLDAFYQDPKRWGLSFNTNVLLSFNDWRKNNFKAIYERSPMSCRHVFTDNQLKSGLMTSLEYSLFDKLYNEIGWEPEAIIYIKTSPKTCFNRTMLRNRNCESNIKEEYLKAIHDHYEIMIKTAQQKGIKVYIIDGEQDEENVHKDIVSIIQCM